MICLKDITVKEASGISIHPWFSRILDGWKSKLEGKLANKDLPSITFKIIKYFGLDLFPFLK